MSQHQSINSQLQRELVIPDEQLLNMTSDNILAYLDGLADKYATVCLKTIHKTLFNLDKVEYDVNNIILQSPEYSHTLSLGDLKNMPFSIDGTVFNINGGEIKPPVPLSQLKLDENRQKRCHDLVRQFYIRIEKQKEYEQAVLDFAKSVNHQELVNSLSTENLGQQYSNSEFSHITAIRYKLWLLWGIHPSLLVSTYFQSEISHAMSAIKPIVSPMLSSLQTRNLLAYTYDLNAGLANNDWGFEHIYSLLQAGLVVDKETFKQRYEKLLELTKI